MEQDRYKIKISNKAQNDIIEIYNFLSKTKLGNPRKRITEILDAIEFVSKIPNFSCSCGIP